MQHANLEPKRAKQIDRRMERQQWQRRDVKNKEINKQNTCNYIFRKNPLGTGPQHRRIGMTLFEMKG